MTPVVMPCLLNRNNLFVRKHFELFSEINTKEATFIFIGSCGSGYRHVILFEFSAGFGFCLLKDLKI